jgi:hypothetical protein
VIDDEEMRNLQQQIDDAVEGGDDAALKAHLLDISDRVTNFVTNYVSERHADDMISGLEELLKTEAEGK